MPTPPPTVQEQRDLAIARFFLKLSELIDTISPAIKDAVAGKARR